MKLRKRKTIKQLAKEKDTLSKIATEATEYYRHHKRKTYIIIASFVGGILLLIGFFNFYFYAQRKGAAELKAAIQLYKKGEEEPKNYEKALKKLNSITFKYFISKSAPIAHLYKANCYYRQGNFEDALKSFQGFVSKHPFHPLLPVAIEGLANTYEEVKNYEKAISYYKEITEKHKDSFNVPYAYLSIGRCLEAQNKLEEAKKVYQKVVDTYPESKWFRKAKLRLDLLEDQSAEKKPKKEALNNSSTDLPKESKPKKPHQ